MNPEIRRTWDNKEIILPMLEAQGFVRDGNGVFQVPQDSRLKLRVPAELIPKCPVDGSDMTLNLRCDDSFVQDDGWYAAESRYRDFLRRHRKGRILYLELGVGMNTPVIIKYPFWQYVRENPDVFYACINKGEAYCPEEIAKRSVCIDADIGGVLRRLS